MTKPKFCSKCGNPLSVGSSFCSECGAPISVQATAPKVAEEASAATPATEAPDLDVGEAPAAAPEMEAPAEDVEAPAPAPDPDDHHDDSIAAMLTVSDDDDLDDHLAMPDDGEGPPKREVPLGTIALACFFAVIVAMAVIISSNDELSARFQCNILGDRAKCVTEADKLWEIEQAEKREEIELMTHHYGGFDLAFSPETDTSFTLRQLRYEEKRDDFVKRVREGADDRRELKQTKPGVYSTGKGKEGVIKGLIRFSANAPATVTYKPERGKELVLPLSLSELPLLEREQIDGNGKRLSGDDIKKLEELKNEAKRDELGRPIYGPELKVRTMAISTWIYEVELAAPGYHTRKVVFYEPPIAPGIDMKKLEKEEKVSFKAFKRRPDGRFVIDNASFDLLPEPKTIRIKYIQVLKELHCLRLSREYMGRSEQRKKDAEELIWEQKAFTPELKDIAHQNDEDPEWLAYKESEFKGYECPKYE
jgi:hypothetical protein